MEISKILKPGDEVRVDTHSDTFISKIFDVTGDTTFTVLRQIGTAATKSGDEYSMTCVNDRGMFVFKAAVIGAYDSPAVIELKLVGDYLKLQRRTTYRVRENLPVKVLELSNDTTPAWIETKTANVSESGVLLKYAKPLAMNQELKVVIHINRYGMDVFLPTLKGKVVRCIKTNAKEVSYLIGVHFEELPERARNEIIKFVVLSQRNQMKDSQTKRYHTNG